MAERVDDRGVAASVAFIDLPLHHRPVVTGLAQRRIGVGDMKHQAH